MSWNRIGGVLNGSALLVLLSTTAYAQAIAGTVRDTSGGILPGVTVEATSPALIEQVRTVTTDSAGQYRIVDLRVGTYTVTFSLAGFSTVVRDGIVLNADFTAPVNVEMRVGALEETVTVTGASPVVDVQNTRRIEVLSRDVLNALPTGRNFWSIGATIPAVSMGRFDVGGSTGMQMSGVSAYGSSQSTMQIDGMSVNSALGSGSNVAFYHNDDAYAEMAYELSGGSAEVKTGGIRINMIPKEGGNVLSGHGIALYNDSRFQSSNMTDELRARGLQAPGGLQRSWDVNGSVGGPIKRDRLWFFSSVRNWAYNQYIANAFYADGRQGIDDNLVEAYTNRLTVQISPRNKFTVMYDKLPKWRGHRELEQGGVAPEAAVVQATPLSYTGQAKLTSTVSSRLLLEAGLSLNLYNYNLSYQPEVRRATCLVAFVNCAPGTDYGDISHVDVILGTRTKAALRDFNDDFKKINIVASASYVTGSHALKAGIQHGFGRIIHGRKVNGDLIQRYRNGVPDSVQVRNTPIYAFSNMDADLALFVQDSWTIDRVTLNPGLRWEYFHGSVPEQNVAGGRFVPGRHFEPIDDVPNWKNFSPRFGAAYDVFGDGRTALKASVGKYMQNQAAGWPDRYNPMVDSTDTRTWNDLNGDDIAQENELGPTTNRTFGVRRNRNQDPDIKRPYDVFYSAGVQQELVSGMALTVSYNRRQYYDQAWTDNLATTHDDYTLLEIPDPRGNGQTLPVYNLDRAKLGLINELDTTSGTNTSTYNGFDIMLSARLPNGGNLLGGTSTGRIRTQECEVDNPNSLRFCDQTEFDIPWATQFKLSGVYPLPYDIQFSGVFTSTRGVDVPVNYVVNRSIVRTLTQPSVTVRLNEPGSKNLDRVNQLDLRFAKTFRRQAVRFSPQLELFNVLNANPVLSQTNTFGPALDRPLRVHDARVLRIGMQVDF